MALAYVCRPTGRPFHCETLRLFYAQNCRRDISPFQWSVKIMRCMLKETSLAKNFIETKGFP